MYIEKTPNDPMEEIYVDGTSLNKPGRAGVRGPIRDCCGRWRK